MCMQSFDAELSKAEQILLYLGLGQLPYGQLQLWTSSTVDDSYPVNFHPGQITVQIIRAAVSSATNFFLSFYT